jgi:hypothetical protein
MASDNRGSGQAIRITLEDANSSHVDDLLKRQANLRGERGIGRSHKKKWYYSNWFVFALAGGLGALLAASVIEPYFDDLPYLRGKITNIGAVQQLPNVPLGDGREMKLNAGAMALAPVTIGQENVWILSITSEMMPDGTTQPLDFETLKVGDEIGAYVDTGRGAIQPPMAMAIFVDRQPTRPSEGLTLAQVTARQTAVSLLLFPSVAALVGLFIGAIDGLICRLWRRVLLAGLIGLLIGFIGGFASTIVAGLVYMPLSNLAAEQQVGMGQFTTVGFLTQVTGRALAWALAGMAMGLGQGVAMRSSRLLLYGFIGGAIGGLLGGILFDPLDLLLLGPNKPSAHLSRFIGVVTIGLTVGLMIGIVELLARDAWLQMLKGPLSGKEFLIFKDLMQLGSSPRSDIYLFNDSGVAERHAVIRAAADQYELEATKGRDFPVLVNGRPTERARLRHGDQITLGSTVFCFQRRQTE